jgi:RimJ/RimL family protein N-acetyltransferase
MWWNIDGGRVLEIGYLFNRAFWHNGYATEAAAACKRYAFDVLGFDEVFSIVRDNNFASMNVAIRNGMLVRGRYVKRYKGEDMPHYIFSARKSDESAKMKGETK